MSCQCATFAPSRFRLLRRSRAERIEIVGFFASARKLWAAYFCANSALLYLLPAGWQAELAVFVPSAGPPKQRKIIRKSAPIHCMLQNHSDAYRTDAYAPGMGQVRLCSVTKCSKVMHSALCLLLGMAENLRSLAEHDPLSRSATNS